MNYRPILLLLAAHAGAALAQYKCTAANGAVTFQQTPCAGGQQEERLVVIPNGHPPAASGVKVPQGAHRAAEVDQAQPGVNKRMLANYELQHQRDALAEALKKAQDQQARRATERREAVAGAQKQFGDDPANAQALKDALAAIASRYQALDMVDADRVDDAQRGLAAWDKAHEQPSR